MLWADFLDPLKLQESLEMNSKNRTNDSNKNTYGLLDWCCSVIRIFICLFDMYVVSCIVDEQVLVIIFATPTCLYNS